jgi:hypothetical protein
MKPSSYYYGDLYDPTIMQKMYYPHALQYKIDCSYSIIEDIPSYMPQHKAIKDAIAYNTKLLDEVYGLQVTFNEPGEPVEYIPKDYLTD